MCTNLVGVLFVFFAIIRRMSLHLPLLVLVNFKLTYQCMLIVATVIVNYGQCIL